VRALVVVALLAGVAHAETPFDQGKLGISAGAGSTSAFGQRYFAIGAGAGIFVVNGLEVGVDGQYQWGDGPSISRLRPAVRYVAQPLLEARHWPLIPYVGVFYSHWFIGDAFTDVDAIGTRAGALYVSGAARGSFMLGLGVAFEHVVSECTDDCNAVYPDLTIAVAL
jgi:hypothetical protein